MITGKKNFTCAQVNQIDIVEYLQSLGHKPAKIKREDYWYYSPLRDEKTPSFKINRRKNVWYDHGIGKGGSLVDLCILYHRCSVKELLEKFSNDGITENHTNTAADSTAAKPLPLINILAEKDLQSGSLLRYLNDRAIAGNIARKYCREINFEINRKKYTAIGFKNDSGGFELHNDLFKGSTSPKTFTTLLCGSKTTIVFEGFFDFLSYQTMHQADPLSSTDFLILNSTALLQKAIAVMEKYDFVHLYLNRDKTGQDCTAGLLLSSDRYIDQSNLYTGYNDLNDCLKVRKGV